MQFSCNNHDAASWHPTGFGSFYVALKSHRARRVGRGWQLSTHLRVGGVRGTFVLLGKGGKVATNRPEEQQASVLVLHLLRACLAYVNILKFRRALAGPEWSSRMAPGDLSALTPPVFGARE